ncbi:beta-lactamase/transpeptidase-like protein [Xylaria bambusicola]|uniref:beta-lactamase/transpeptidase-like protein n=1 Tax=Xylaria bambusicola TaxID=326684 RepID=UPI002007F483|nr:beta-lactamase/transpeptidase-like protein [Xylaria bambusicola]KAI0515076.1 beta-lactamase/transpeptidase-like protein [Xylaria bambusicola]
MLNPCRSAVVSWLLVVAATSTTAKLNCPLYGLGYPKPTNLLASQGIKGAASALDSVFPQFIDNANGTGSARFSYSVEVFSASEDNAPLWSHYWTAKNLAMMNTTGVKKIDGDTVYRIGSLTKVFTMLTFLAEVGDSVWNDPIAKYIPEVADMAANSSGSSHSLTTPDWGSITIGSLASQISGLMRDCMPNLTSGDIPPCGSNPVCSRSQFFNGLTKLPPAFQPFVTPAYSDVGYVLLAYALEKMTGRSFQESFEEKVIKPLNLTRTFYRAPADSLGVIPGDRWKTTWAFFMGNESPTGGLYSSSTDMAKVGRAILKSTLFPGPVTRRWLRPVTFSSDPSSSVGSPWGVRRLTLIGQNSTYQFATTFNKLGSIGTYSALLAVIPDFDIGFSVAAAGEIPAALVTSIADTLAKTYLPTLQGVSRLQANASYAGYYKSETINSSVTISVDATAPGLGVGNWMSNGTSMMGLSVALSSNISRDYWDAMQPSVRLYPSGLWDALPNGGKKVGFKATFEDLAGPSVAEMYTTDCSTWIGMSGIVYGSQPLDEFVFELDKDGVAVAVENAALRSRMVKVV